MKEQDYKVAIELWNKAVDTQIHFNEMSHKARQLGLSFAVTTLGICVGVYSTNAVNFSALTRGDACGLLVLIASFGIFAVAFLELRHYQKLLIGAVLFGEKLESAGFSEHLPIDGAGMTAHISFAAKDRAFLQSIYPRKEASQWKILGFYTALLTGMMIMAGLFFLSQDASKLPGGSTRYFVASIIMLGIGLYSIRPDPPQEEPDKPAKADASQTTQKAA